MTTDAKTETEYVRPINELLSLKTYQGMNDLEIETLLSYKINLAITQHLASEKRAAIMLEMEQRIADNKASCETTAHMLESMLNRDNTSHATEVKSVTARRTQAQKSSATTQPI